MTFILASEAPAGDVDLTGVINYLQTYLQSHPECQNNTFTDPTLSST